MTVPVNEIGDTYLEYGAVYVSDLPTFGSISGNNYSYDEYPCIYDAATSTFTFTTKYFVASASFNGEAVETLEVAWDAAARGTKAKNAVKTSKKWGLIKILSSLAIRFIGKKMQKVKHDEFRPNMQMGG